MFFFLRNIYLLALCSEKAQSYDNLLAMNIHSTQIIPTKGIHGSLEKWLISGLGQKMYKLSLGHLLEAESNQATKE